jgi:hypothetical protein
MTDDERAALQAERERLEAKARARRGQPGFAENVAEIDARIAEIDAQLAEG